MTLVVLYVAAIRLMALLYPEEDHSRFIGPALLSAGLLAFSGPFWLHSLVAEVYTLHAFFIALVFLLLLLWRQKDDVRFLYSAALTYGVSSGNHATMAFLLPAILVLYFCWNREHAVRHLLTSVLFFLIGLSVYGYLPIRSLAEPSMDWGNPETLKGFIYHVTDRKDADTHFSYFRDSAVGVKAMSFSVWASLGAALGKIWHVVRTFLTDVTANLTPIAALGFLLGAGLCWKRNRPLFLFTFLIVAINAAFFVGWRKESYFPSYIVVCLFTAVALFAILFRGKERKKPLANNGSSQKTAPIDWRRLVFVGIACVVPFNAISNYQKADRSGLYFGETLLKRVSLSLEDKSLFITGMSWFNFYYYNDVMRLRDDVTAIKAWNFMRPDVPAVLTERRYPDLVLPDASRHRFDSRTGSLKYVEELLKRNESQRPVLMDQNLTFFEQFPLEENFQPYRNLLLKYRSGSSEDIKEPDSIQTFDEFKIWLQEEVQKPGVYRTEWINKVSFYVPSFATHYHQTKRYREERQVLKLMHDFLGQQGPDWWFKRIDNLILDAQNKKAGEELVIMKTRFPNRFATLFIEGLLLRADGKLDASRKQLQRAVALKPKEFRPSLELATTLKMMGEDEQAARELDRAGKNIRNLREWKRMQQELTS
jgi:tetratricopeptide (TPR) repeat protein